jgi:hypothetical protein
MNYRIAKILAEEAITAAGTKTIDLKVQDPISRIDIRHVITKASDGMAAHPAADITKIELVDGSDVLFSMTGYEAQALNIYDRRCWSMLEGDRSISVDQVAHYGIDFGRFLWDEALALLPKRFNNPQLKISHTLIGSDASATAGKLEVIGFLLDQKAISPMGFLMSKEHYSYTCAAENSYEYIDLPKDYLLRKLLIRAYRAGYEPWAQIKEFKLDEENEKRIPLEWDMENYARFMKGYWSPIKEYISGQITGGSKNYYITPTDYCSVAAMGGGTEALYYDGTIKGGKVTLYLASGSCSFQAQALGFCPNHCVEVPFGKNDDPNDWYDIPKIGALRLRLKGGSSTTSGTGQVVLQQLRRY